MATRVYFHPVADEGLTLGGPDLRPGLAALGRSLGLPGAPGAWAVKVDLGAPHRPAPVAPAWTRAVVAALGATRGGGSFVCETLSITTAGLEEAAAQRDLAKTKGYGTGADDLPFVVADDPDAGPALSVSAPPGSTLTGHTLAGALARADNLCLLTPIRPHPHVGWRGAVANLGLGLADRAGKIALHRDIRPRVDTPLCAGCGVCMTVCLFDAIKLNAGRAYIDHTLCTGCGECMNVCFMAGIAPEETAGIPRFQAAVAEAALAAGTAITGGETARGVFFNLLVGLERQPGGVRSRDRGRLGDIGVLAARDPVALDQATQDLLDDRAGGDATSWSGFKQLPETLLARAAAIGLGQRTYDLVTV